MANLLTHQQAYEELLAASNRDGHTAENKWRYQLQAFVVRDVMFGYPNITADDLSDAMGSASNLRKLRGAATLTQIA